MTSSKVGAVIFGHGTLPDALLETAQGIAGPLEGVRALSNRGRSRAALETELERALAEFGADRPVIVFVDLFGGSCSTVGGRLCAPRPNVAVLAGINLPILLEFAFARERCGFRELVTHLLETGRNEIRQL